MSDGMSPDELAALYFGPSAQHGPAAEGIAPQATIPVHPQGGTSFDPFESDRRLREAEHQRQLDLDHQQRADEEHQRQIDHQNRLAAFRRDNDAKAEQLRYQQAVAQLSGVPAQPVPLNRVHYAKKQTFLLGFVIGAAAACAAFALNSWWSEQTATS